MPDALTVASLYRLLPSLDKLLQSRSLEDILQRYPRGAAVRSARAALARIRAEIRLGTADEVSIRSQVGELPSSIAAEMESGTRFSLRRVINATGVILHTNLGRAPLSRSALDHICQVARDYFESGKKLSVVELRKRYAAVIAERQKKKA